ncbi:uncharacterized protein LOC141663658 [Apium graveolens]|uniref:uncharacterized protein LOC141663658 n=1 Tax=Apium graveolens TaxID=4045 RepID=UPI003D798BE2
MADNQLQFPEAVVETSKTVGTKVRDVDDHVCIENCTRKELVGIPVLEVYSITYFGCAPLEAEDQIGSISLTTNNRHYHLYFEAKLDPSKTSIKYGDQLPVWNGGPICSFTDLELKFDLLPGRYKDRKEVVVPFEKDKDWLAKPSMKSEDGYMRDISVLFGCFSNATIANIKVMLSQHILSEAETDVYGVVLAANSKFDHPSSTSHLFSKNLASKVQVEYNGLIPLSKSRVGVPLDSRLYVDISLFYNGLHYKGSADFTPGEKSKVVDNQILVKITWNCNEDSYSTDEDSNFTDEDSDFTDEELDLY